MSKNRSFTKAKGKIKLKKETKTEVRSIIKNNNNTAQKKYLSSRKQLRVWLEAEKFDHFKTVASDNGTSMHRLINDFIDDYLLTCGNQA